MGAKTPAAREDSVVLWARSVVLPVVLAILATEGDSHGYQIKRAIEDRHLSGPPYGVLYRLLDAIEEDGLVESSWQKGEATPARHIYRITPAGTRRLVEDRNRWAAFAREVDSILDTAVGGAKEDRTESV